MFETIVKVATAELGAERLKEYADSVAYLDKNYARGVVSNQQYIDRQCELLAELAVEISQKYDWVSHLSDADFAKHLESLAG